MRFSEAVEEFMLEKAIDTSEATQRYYEERLRYFQRDTGIEELESFTPSSITRYLHGKRHLSPASVLNYRRALSVFASWAYRRKLLDENPFDVLPKARKPRHERPSVFTSEQLAAIFHEAKKGPQGKRNIALLMLLLDTGIRIGEAANVELHDIDWDAKTMRVTGKTGEREVPFSGRTSYVLRTYLNRHRRAPLGEKHLFVTNQGRAHEAKQLSLAVRRVVKRAGVEGPKLGPHTFRHTFAHLYLLSGGDSLSLMRLLGHTTTFMTSQYTRMQSGSLKQLHERHSPVKNVLSSR